MFGKKDMLRKKLGPCPVCGTQGWRSSETFTGMLTCPVCKSQLIIGEMEVKIVPHEPDPISVEKIA